MPAVRQVHPQYLVAVIERGHQHRHIRLCPAVRLDIGMLGTKYLLGPVDGKLLDNIGKLAPAVIPLARIPLGIFVGKHRAHRLQHSLGHKVLRRDQLKPISLPPDLVSMALLTSGSTAAIFAVKKSFIILCVLRKVKPVDLFENPPFAFLFGQTRR